MALGAVIGVAGLTAAVLSSNTSSAPEARPVTPLAVRCVDGTGSPLAGFEVSFFDHDQPQGEPRLRTLSDVDGKAVLPALSAQGRFFCIARSSDGAIVSQCFVEQGDGVRDLLSAPPTPIEGRVVNTSDQGVPGALVEARVVGGPVLEAVKSGDDGSFVLRAVSSSLPFVHVSARQIGHALAEASWDRQTGGALALVLAKTQALRLELRGPDAQPLAKLRVSIVGMPGRTTQTDEAGRCEFGDLPYGDAYFVLIDHPRFTYRWTSYTPSNDIQVVRLEVPRTLRATAVDAGLVPLPGIEVRHNHGPRRWVRSITDARGHFEIGDLPSGRVQFFFEARDREGSFVAEVGEEASSAADAKSPRRIVLQ